MVFARRAFTWAAIYGVIVLAPNLFLEGYLARSSGPVAYPEFYYGFTGAALVFQAMFFVIGRDPVRFRPLMLVGVAEKLSFAVPCWTLYALHRLGDAAVLPFATIDLGLGVLFAISYARTPKG